MGSDSNKRKVLHQSFPEINKGTVYIGISRKAYYEIEARKKLDLILEKLSKR